LSIIKKASLWVRLGIFTIVLRESVFQYLISQFEALEHREACPEVGVRGGEKDEG